MFFGKALVRFDRVGRDTHDLSPGRLILRPVIADRAQLRRANRCVVAGVKKQHDGLSALIAERPGISFAVVKSKVRGLLSGSHRTSPTQIYRKSTRLRHSAFSDPSTSSHTRRKPDR